MVHTKRLGVVTALTLLTTLLLVSQGAAQAKKAPKAPPPDKGKPAPVVSADPAVQIEADAEAAVKAGKYAKAVTLFRGLVALKKDDPVTVFRLSEIYTLAGQYEDAIAQLERFVAVSKDEDKVAKAKTEIDRLQNTPAPFFEAVFKPEAAKNEAAKLFKVGTDLVKKKKWAEAVANYEASMLLDPDLPGPYRASGAAYDKLGDKKKKVLFFSEYLRLRPDGKTADEIRKTLAKEKVLGKLSIDSSFPCDLYINGRPMGKKTPVKDLTLPTGRYTVTLVNDQFHLVKNMRIKMESTTKPETAKFDFGILQLKLTPWARVKVDGRDLGLWDELGVPVGDYKLDLASYDGTKTKQESVTVASGKRVLIDKW